MRADRLLSVLLLLQVHRRMTARELASRLEVSERTIHRDMEALSANGFPVFAERGFGGGWMLVEGYRTNLTGLNKDEIQALFLTKPLRVLADLGLEKASNAALTKLSAVSFKANLPQYQATVRVHPDIFPLMSYAGRFARIGQVSEPDAEGWLTVSLRFDVEEMACEYVLSFGSRIEVLEPQTLGEKVVAAAESVIAFYRKRASASQDAHRQD